MTVKHAMQWKKFASLPADIAIWAIASQSKTGSLWLCTSQGLYQVQAGNVQQHLQGAPCQSVATIDKTILVAGHPNQVIYSVDNGKTWLPSRMEMPGAPITCFAASPNFSLDGTLLAGSDGDGILRSTNGGNAWMPSNFGLRSRHIHAIAWAPASPSEPGTWSSTQLYEIVIAASENGVYRSMNGGRGWQLCSQGLPHNTILSLAASPDFGRLMKSRTQSLYRGALFAGTEGAGLYISQDGGDSWNNIEKIGKESTINALRFDRNGDLIAAISEQGLLASSNQGKTWQSIMQAEEVILCLEENDGKLLAGSSQNGLWIMDT